MAGPEKHDHAGRRQKAEQHKITLLVLVQVHGALGFTSVQTPSILGRCWGFAGLSGSMSHAHYLGNPVLGGRTAEA